MSRSAKSRSVEQRRKAHEPVFPAPGPVPSPGKGQGSEPVLSSGLTKREYFSIEILKCVLPSLGRPEKARLDVVVSFAVDIADALIAELNDGA